MTAIDTSKADAFAALLAGFTGTDNWYQDWIGSLVFTDGVLAMAEQGGAYWLIDAISSHQSPRLDQAAGGFQLWTLTKEPTEAMPGRAVLLCMSDSGESGRQLIRQVIEYTDFPLESIRLYVEGTKAEGRRVLLLPSEH